MTVGLATTPPATTMTRGRCYGVAKTTVGDARAIDMVFEDERKRKCEMYAEEGANAFRENAFGRVTMRWRRRDAPLWRTPRTNPCRSDVGVGDEREDERDAREARELRGR